LGYFLSSLNSVGRSLLQSSRFSRQMRRFGDFATAAMAAVASPDPMAVACPEAVAKAYRGSVEAKVAADEFDEEDD